MTDNGKIKHSCLEYFKNDDLAANVWLTKYALKDKEGNLLEETPNDMHRRLAKEFARVEKKFGGKNKLSESDIYNFLKDFKYIVPQGSPMFGIGNNHVNVSLSNCVVVEPPKDNVSSIIEAGKELANLMKRRAGVGIDISKLRPENTPVNNSARTTSGAWTFADFYSYVCRMIGQNGRRGALMITMDVRHPDIEKFVTMKHDLRKVTGANVSIKISDSFMEAVEKGEEFTLQFPVGSETPTVSRHIDAKKLWNEIVKSATKTAEPGILMWDNIIKNLPAHEYEQFKTVCTNPCSEIPLSAYDSCRLISINLKNFVKKNFTDEAYFDFDYYKEVIKAAMRLSDDLVELEIEKLENIIRISDTPSEKQLWRNLLNACQNGRRTGLGTHGLADALAGLKLAYDSPEALKVVDLIYKTLKESAYSSSIELAKERGSFPVYNWEKERNNAFICSLPKKIQQQIEKFGRRNISILTNAPTGSVSILSQTSSGIEPVFRNVYKRRRKLNHNEQDIKADFIDDLGDRWKEYDVMHHSAQECLAILNISEIPSYFVESDAIDWEQRIRVQAVIQRHIDHAIASTINLPKGTTPEVVSRLYQLGWELGLKGITVYVDGSRSGVLLAKQENIENKKTLYHCAPKRPDTIECDIHHTTIKGEKWTILVGLLDGEPYEVMGGLSNLIEIPKKYIKGTIKKHRFKTKDSRYDLTFGEDKNEVVIRDIIKVFDNPDNSVFTRMISLALRHGAKPSFLMEQLLRTKESEMFSFSRCLARIMKTYIPDGETRTDKHCSQCGAEGMVYQDGCKVCKGCGYAKCG